MIHTLPSTTHKTKRRLGRGHGSGRGKTSGRGTKGQNVRNKVPLHFEGGALPLTKRLPFLRGKGRNKSFKVKPVELKTHELNVLPAKSVVDVETLIASKILEQSDARAGAKLIGGKDLTVPLTVKIPVSKGARTQIEKAGGTVEI